MNIEEKSFLINYPKIDPIANLILAHGAGAPMDTPFMEQMAEGLSSEGIAVFRFEFPYMSQTRLDGKKRPPNNIKVLMEHFMAAINTLTSSLPLFLAGKSMGGRIATMLADKTSTAGVLCFGYPFHPPGKPDSLRTDHLESLRTPCLMVQGERDPFGTIEEVPNYPLSRSISIKWLPDGDHSFKPRKMSGFTLEENLRKACSESSAFIREHLSH